VDSCCGGPPIPISPILACLRAIGTDGAMAGMSIDPVKFSGQTDASTVLTADRPWFSPADAPATAMVTRIATADDNPFYGFAAECYADRTRRWGTYEINDPINWWRFIEIIAYSYIS